MGSKKSFRTKFEARGNELLVKRAPYQLPNDTRKLLVEWLPWFSLAVGIAGLVKSYMQWHNAHTVTGIVTYMNSYTTATPVYHLSRMFWVSLLALLFTSILMLIAVRGLKTRSKSTGWDLVVLVALVDFVGGIIYMLFGHDTGNNMLFTLIGALFTFYVLFQIRSSYSDRTVRSK